MRKSTPKTSKVSSVTPASHFLSFEELESAHKTKDKVKIANVKSLGGSVYTRPTSAGTIERFLDMFDRRESLTQKEMIDTLAKFASDVVCDQNGDDFFTIEQAKKLSIETLNELCIGVATASTARGKGSRR